MARVPQITTKEAVPADKQSIFDEIAASRGGRMPAPFALMLNSPEVAGRVAHLGTYLRFECVLPTLDRELAFATAARENDCEMEWNAHSRLAREAGAREQAIESIDQKAPLDQLTPEEALIVGFVRELIHNHRVSEATFEAAKARYGDQGVTELTAGIGYYTLVSFAINNLG